MTFNGRSRRPAVHRVVLTELGVAVYDGASHARSFPFKDPAAEYLAAKEGDLGMLSGLVEYLSGLDGAGIAVSDAGLLAGLRRGAPLDCQAMDAGDAEAVQASKPTVLVESGFASDHADAMSRLRDFALALSAARVAEASGSADMHIIQAIKSLDDVDRMANLLDLRMREWYGLHFPELGNLVDGVAGYAKVVLAGRRGGLGAKDFEAAGFDDAKVQMLAAVSGQSRGGEMSDEDLEAVQGLARQVGDLHELRGRIEERLEGQMGRAAPNLTAILGAAVGARIMARAGSLRRLAMMPASTIQLLGAEKALFRSLKAGSRPPKHGLLFQHPLVHAAPRWQRGKVARAVAAKAAIAARVDLHEPRLNESLLEKLNVRVGEIGRKYADPPEPRGDEDEGEDGDGRNDDGGGGGRGGRGVSGRPGGRRPPPRERYGQRRPRGGRDGGRDGGGSYGRGRGTGYRKGGQGRPRGGDAPPPRVGRRRGGGDDDSGYGRGGGGAGKKGRYGGRGGGSGRGGYRRDYEGDDDGGRGGGSGRGGYRRDYDGDDDGGRGRGGGSGRGGGAFGRPFGGRRPAGSGGRAGGYGRGRERERERGGGDGDRGPSGRPVGPRRGAGRGQGGKNAPSWAPKQGGRGAGAGSRGRRGAGDGSGPRSSAAARPKRRKRF